MSVVCRNVQSSDLSAAGTKKKKCHLQPGISLTLNRRWGVPLSSWISSTLTLHFPQRSDFNEICAVTQIKYCRHPVSIGLPRSSLKWSVHTALPWISPNASLSLLVHPPLRMRKKSIFTYRGLLCSSPFWFSWQQHVITGSSYCLISAANRRSVEECKALPPS